MPALKEFADTSFSFSISPKHLLSQKNIDDLEQLTQLGKTDFDVIASAESRLIKDKLPPTDISLKIFSYENCPMVANAGGTLIYIRNHLSYTSRSDLNHLN